MSHGPYYRGWRTALLIASGTSLTDAQLEQARAAHESGVCRAIVINDTWSRAPWADVLYGCDGAWWRAPCNPVVAKLQDCSGMRNVSAARTRSICEFWTQDHEAANALGLHYVACVREVGLTSDPSVIHLAGNSGHQAINLAYLFGATRMVLLGYDMQRGPKTRDEPNGRAHWFGNHPNGLRQGEPTSWIQSFQTLAKDAHERGVSIVNCSEYTALKCFPRAKLEDALTQSK